MARKIKQLVEDPAEAVFWGAVPEGALWVDPSRVEINMAAAEGPLAEPAPAATDKPAEVPPTPRLRARAKRKKA
jgi:hypothetical protein